MVLHDPEVKEQLEKFGVPVLVERSSYESGPLARMEWLKLYGILLNKTEMAEEVFRQKVEQVTPILEQENTGKTVAFFSITTNNLITVRRTSDYVAQMVGMAGGVYIFDDLEGGDVGPVHHQTAAGDVLRPGQGRRRPHLQQHHRGRDGDP